MIPGIMGAKVRGPVDPVLDLNFLERDFLLESRVTAAGGANGARFNRAGTFTAKAAPRIDFDPVGLACRGLLIEEGRSNIALQSAAFSNASWSKLNGTATADTTAAPDGTATADTLAATGADCVVYQDIAVAGASDYTFSVWLRAAGATNLSIFIFTTAWVQVATQAVAVTATWQRFTVSGNSGANGTLRFAIGGGNTFSNPETVFAWGAQVELSSGAAGVKFATSHVPTTAAAVARSQDNVSMTGTDFSAWYGASEGTFATEFMVPNFPTVGGAGNAGILEIDDGTFNNAIALYVYQTGGVGLLVFSGGVLQANPTVFLPIATNAVVRAAIAYAAGSFRLSVNGSVVANVAAGAVPAVNRMTFGEIALGQKLNGWVRRVRYFRGAVSDADLRALST